MIDLITASRLRAFIRAEFRQGRKWAFTLTARHVKNSRPSLRWKCLLACGPDSYRVTSVNPSEAVRKALDLALAGIEGRRG